MQGSSLVAGEQAVPIINKSEFEETLIPLPPTKAEQTAQAQGDTGSRIGVKDKW